MFPVISALEDHARVMSLGYPPDVTRVDDIVEGIRLILQEENLDSVSILGHSLGALFGKCFTQKYPENVDSLILANFADPSSSHALLTQALLAVLIILPWQFSVRIVKAQFQRLLKDCRDPFWISYLTSARVNASLKHIQNQYRCMLDYLRNWPPSKWDGPVLILESDHERVTAAARKALRALYVNARIHIFHEAGHLSWITQEREFIETTLDFLVGKNP